VGQIYCALLAGCERTVDFQRAEQWRQVAQPFLEAYDQVGVTGTCRATYGGVLAATGYWSEAERELLHALRIFDAGARGMRADAIVRLADLRNQLSATNLQAAPILLRLVEAQIAAGDPAAARASATVLARFAAEGSGDGLRGMAGLASGLVIAAEGGDPVSQLDAALEHLDRALMRWEAARARLAVAEAVATLNPELAIREARLATVAFTALGAVPGADRARSLLRRLGVRTAGGARVKAGLSRREEDVARLVGLGLSNDQIAAQLFLSPRTVEHHITSILRKLPASGRTEIATYAVRRLGT
jgi:DNA-binding CsgD family transcriptional regulator